MYFKIYKCLIVVEYKYHHKHLRLTDGLAKTIPNDLGIHFALNIFASFEYRRKAQKCNEITLCKLNIDYTEVHIFANDWVSINLTVIWI